MRDNAEVVKNDVMEEAVAGRCPPCVWGNGVNDDLPFGAKRTCDWSKRSLSIRQAGQGTTSWTGSQILGRSLEDANCLFKTFHHFNTKTNQNPPTQPPSPSTRGDRRGISAPPTPE